MKHLIPSFLKRSHDGGTKSGVTGFWLIEWKPVFSIVLLRFSKGTREAFHNHAFHAITWFLRGLVTEEHLDGRKIQWRPSIIPKLTPRNCFHKVIAHRTTYALSIRGPWLDKWNEYRDKERRFVTLAHGRKEL